MPKINKTETRWVPKCMKNNSKEGLLAFGVLWGDPPVLRLRTEIHPYLTNRVVVRKMCTPEKTFKKMKIIILRTSIKKN